MLENKINEYETDFNRLGIYANAEDDVYDDLNKQKNAEPKPKGWRWRDLITPSRRIKKDKPKYQPPEVEYDGETGDWTQ